MNSHSAFKTITTLGLCCLLSGCYYVQATRGQIEVLRKREPIDEVIASPDTAAELGRRLRLVQEARRFSVTELGLPDKRAPLWRPFIFAQPIRDFSLTSRRPA